jgi:hypothetical protein
MHFNGRVGGAAALMITAMVIAACGGSASATPAAATPDGGNPEATLDIAPTTAPDPNAATPDAGLPSFDPSGLSQNLEGVDSYRVTVTTDGDTSYRAAVVTKPVLSRDILLGDDADAQRLVVIGDEAWSGTGDDLVAMPSELASSMLLGFDPMLMFGGFTQLGAWQGAADQGTESRNGVQARHFHIDDGTFLGGVAAAAMPAGASIDAWVAEDGGYLVALEIVGADDEGFVVDVTDINDPGITVERPS